MMMRVMARECVRSGWTETAACIRAGVLELFRKPKPSLVERQLEMANRQCGVLSRQLKVGAPALNRITAANGCNTPAVTTAREAVAEIERIGAGK